MDQWWSWLLGSIGLVGFYFSGKKLWWAWYINIANQILWYAYAIVTEQWGFFMTATAYTIMFSWNAYKWTRERFIENEYAHLQEQLVSDRPAMDSFPIEKPKVKRAQHRFTINALDYDNHEEFNSFVNMEADEWWGSLTPEEKGRGFSVFVEDDFRYPHIKKIRFEVYQ